MPFTYEIRTADDAVRWPLSGACIAATGILAKTGLTSHLSAVALSPDAETGVEHRLNRHTMLEAIAVLIPPARRAIGGYRVRARHTRCTPDDDDLVCRAISGLRIGGGNYWIACRQSDWAITPHATPPTPPDFVHPIGFQGERRTGPAEFATQNMGIVRVEPKRGQSLLATLLTKIQAFAESVEDETLRVTVG
jgi:hypothetical protein